MSERKSYEDLDRGFSDLSMPDEEASWQKMKELLEKDDDAGRSLPPVLLRSCIGWGLVLLAGLIAGWLVFRPQRWWALEKSSLPSSNSNYISESRGRERGGTETIQHPHADDLENNLTVGKRQNVIIPSAEPFLPHLERKITTGNRVGSNNRQKAGRAVIHNRYAVLNGAADNTSGSRNSKDLERQKEKPIKTDSFSLKINKQQVSTIKDSANNLNSPAIESTLPTKSSTAQKKLIVAAGLGLQQLIPIAGQTLVPYSYYGRDGSIADYIPSVYVQLHKKGKWFVMGEFRFGAAQSVKEFSYNRETRYDTTTMNTTVTTMRLKKTYYHQLPFSFNYYVRPNLSLGIGGMYSRFYGAITEKETDTWNSVTQKYTDVKEIIPMKRFNDSFLYKTQVHVLLQADYQWKRLSFGLRYTRDVQPYIKYTNPDGTVDEKRNQSLQLMVRYRIWESAKL